MAGLAIVLALAILVVPEKTLATQILVFGLFAQQFAQVAVFSLMALVLLVRPRGLLGTA